MYPAEQPSRQRLQVPGRSARRPHGGRLQLDGLEDRIAPAVDFYNFGGLTFRGDFTSDPNAPDQLATDTFDVGTPVHVGLDPDGGEFYPLWQIDGHVFIPDPDRDSESTTFQIGDPADKASTIALAQVPTEPVFWRIEGDIADFDASLLSGEQAGGLSLTDEGSPVGITVAGIPTGFEIHQATFIDADDPANASMEADGELNFDTLPVNLTALTVAATIQVNSGVTLESVEAKLALPSFQAGGVTITGELGVEYDQEEKQFSFFGGAKFEAEGLSGQQGSELEVLIGTQSDPGMTITDGALDKIAVGLTGEFEAFGLAFAPDQLTFEYNLDTNSDQYLDFIMFGALSVKVPNGEASDGGSNTTSIQAQFGDSAEAAGLVIDTATGTVERVDVAVSGTLNILGFTLESPANNPVHFVYDATQALYELSGEVTAPQLFDTTVTMGTPAQPGIQIEDGSWSVNDLEVSFADVNLGAFKIKNLDVTFMQDGTDLEFDFEIDILFPGSWEVDGEIDMRFNTATKQFRIHEIFLKWRANKDSARIPIGPTGLFLREIDATLNNLDQPSDLVVSGHITAEYGDTVKLFGKSTKFLSAVGAFTVDRNHLEIDADIYLGSFRSNNGGKPSGVLGEGTGKVLLDWNEGKYTVDLKAGLVDDIFQIDADFEFDRGGAIWIAADARVVMPKQIPFIGGKTLASLDFRLAYSHTDLDNSYVAAWTTVDLLFTKKAIGIEYEFGEKKVKVIGNKAINRLSQDPFPQSPSVDVYSQTFDLAANQAEYTTGLVTSTPAAGSNQVTMHSPDGASVRRVLTTELSAFPQGVRTAAGDVTGDGVVDLILVARTGGSPLIQVIDGVNNTTIASFEAFESSFTGGVYAATGDVDGDGWDDIVVSAGPGGGPRVRVFSGKTFLLIADFFAFDDPNFRGGIHVAMGDLNGDQRADLIVAAGAGGGPRIMAFDGASLTRRPTKIVGDFLAFNDPGYRGGASITLADVNGDQIDDLIVGAGAGGGPRVAVFNGVSLSNSPQRLVADHFAFEPSHRGGVMVAGGDIDGDGFAEVVAAPGRGGAPRVIAVSGSQLAQRGAWQEVMNFFAGNPSHRDGADVTLEDLNESTPAGPGATNASFSVNFPSNDGTQTISVTPPGGKEIMQADFDPATNGIQLLTDQNSPTSVNVSVVGDASDSTALLPAGTYTVKLYSTGYTFANNPVGILDIVDDGNGNTQINLTDKADGLAVNNTISVTGNTSTTGANSPYNTNHVVQSISSDGLTLVTDQPYDNAVGVGNAGTVAGWQQPQFSGNFYTPPPTVTFTEQPPVTPDGETLQLSIAGFADKALESGTVVDVYLDRDDTGYDGRLLQKGVSLTFNDSGNFTATTDLDIGDLFSGTYHLYLVIDDGVNTPVFSAYTNGFRPPEAVQGTISSPFSATNTSYLVPRGTAGNQPFSGPLGMAFDVNEPVRITELGVFDDLSNGLKNTLTATLWDRTDTTTPMATLTFTPGDPGRLDGGSRFKPLPTPVTLPAGFQGLIVAQGYGANERNGNSVSPAWTTNSGDGAITFVGPSRYGNTPGVYPDQLDTSTANRFAAGTFNFQAASRLKGWQVFADLDRDGVYQFSEPISGPSNTDGQYHLVPSPGDLTFDVTSVRPAPAGGKVIVQMKTRSRDFNRGWKIGDQFTLSGSSVNAYNRVHTITSIATTPGLFTTDVDYTANATGGTAALAVDPLPTATPFDLALINPVPTVYNSDDTTVTTVTYDGTSVTQVDFTPKEYSVIRGNVFADLSRDGIRVESVPAARYDFGTQNSPVQAGYTQVTRQMTYTEARGYGWLNTVQNTNRSNGTTPVALTRDFVLNPEMVFQTDLPNASYDVTLTIGDDTGRHDQVGVFLQGAQVDKVTTMVGQFVEKTYANVVVSDGTLTLRLASLGGTDPNAVLNGMTITRADDPALGGFTVELLQGGQVVATTLSGTDGSYRFARPEPGDYMVRVIPWNGSAATYTFEADTLSTDGAQTQHVADASGNPRADRHLGTRRNGAAINTAASFGIADHSNASSGNQVLKLNGAEQYVDVPAGTDLQPGRGAFSFSGWFRVDDPAKTQDIAGMNDPVQPNNGWALRISYNQQTSRRLSVVLRQSSGVGLQVGAGPELQANTWYHVAFTFDPNSVGANGLVTPDAVRIYVNGIWQPNSVIVSDGLPANPDVSTGDTVDFTIGARGARGTNTSFLFSGYLDDVAVWKSTLTPLQVRSLYHGVPSPAFTQSTPSSPVTYSLTVDGEYDVHDQLDFGLTKSIAVGGMVKGEALNARGVLDPSKEVLAGWEVQLVDETDVVVQTATTGEDGQYIFPGVPTGTYTIQQPLDDLKAGWRQIAPQDATVQFSDPITQTFGVWSDHSVAVDFDQDGHMDIAIAPPNPNGIFIVVVYFGNGDGTFDEQLYKFEQTGITGTIVDLLAGDVTGNGRTDLVVIGNVQAPPVLFRNQGKDRTSLFSNDGHSLFVPQFDFIRPYYSGTIGDFDGDGNDDVIVAGLNPNDPSFMYLDFASVNTNRARAYSSGYVTVPGTVSAEDVSLDRGYLNDDSHLDVLLTVSGVVYVWYGTGDGHFQTPFPLFGVSGNIPKGPGAFGDVNRDGRLDVALPISLPSGSSSVAAVTWSLQTDPSDSPGVTSYIVPENTVGNQQPNSYVQYNLGMNFDVGDRAITVTDLGLFISAIPEMDVLSPLRVNLFERTTRTLVASRPYDSSVSYIEGASQFMTLDQPVYLPAGFKGTIVGAGYGKSFENSIAWNGNSGSSPTGPGTNFPWTTDDGGGLIKFVGPPLYVNTLNSGDEFTYPTSRDVGPPNQYAAGTFKFKQGAVLGDDEYNFITGAFDTTQAMVVQDVNGDLRPDLLVYGTKSNQPEPLRLLLNRGDGPDWFHLPATLNAPASNRFLIADWNGDDLPDLTVANFTEGANQVQLSTYLNETKLTNQAIEIVLDAEDESAGNDFVNGQTSQLTGSVHVDTDGDGEQDAEEPGLGATTVYVDRDRDGRLDEGEPVSVTQADGSYAFDGLPVGRHQVRVLENDGHILTHPALAVHTVDVLTGPTSEQPLHFAATPAWMASLPDHTIEEGMSFMASVTITELGGQRDLTFSLEPGAPANAMIDPSTGEITWDGSRSEGPGTYSIVVRATDTTNSSQSQTRTFRVTEWASPPVGQNTTGQFSANGPGRADVTVYQPDGTDAYTVTVTDTPASLGTTPSAVADVTGDGTPDLVVGSGVGSPPQVRVFDGVTQEVVTSFIPFEPTFTGGVHVAAGDVTDDGRADIVVTPADGGGPRVRVFSGDGLTILADFWGINDPDFRGGLHAALADLNRDGVADLIVGAGAGGGPRLAAYDGATIGTGSPAKLFADLFAFEPSQVAGVHVTAADVNGDSIPDLVIGAGPGSAPRVRVLSGADLLGRQAPEVVADFYAGDSSSRGGVRVAGKDLDGDVYADLVIGSGPDTLPEVRTYLGRRLVIGEGEPETAFRAFEEDDPGGIYVG